MADIFARQRQLIGSTADWAANNIVLGLGEIGVERVSASDVRIKIGDGTATWSALPYASASSTSINAATQAAIDAKVSLAGDRMTGRFYLAMDGTAPFEATTKQQLDAAITPLTTSVNGKLSTAGGTMTGSLTLSGPPTAGSHAATKDYADTAAGMKVDRGGDTMTGFLTLNAAPTAPLHAATKDYVDNGSHLTVVGGSAAYAGRTVRLNAQGVLDSSIVPVGARYLGTVDVTVPYGLTGTYTNGDYFAVAKTGTIDGSWVAKLTAPAATAGAGQFLIYTNGKFDLVGDTTSSAAINGKLDKTGGTLTGALILAADPTVALGAATKQYADKMVPLAGGTMTGLLTLSGNATAALGATTKQQVDAIDTAIRTAFAAADTAITTAYQAADAARLPLAGGTLTGALTLAADPTAALQAATKQYVDGKVQKITVGTAAPASPALNDLWVDTN